MGHGSVPAAGLALCLLSTACLAPSPAPPMAEPAPRVATRMTPDWARDAVFYELFVRSFQDSDGDGIGDLKGLLHRLDYLDRDLGVTALWLMPIFPSPSYHGYDVTDFRSIDPVYGTLDDLDRLIQAAHARGIRLLLDLPLNHTSDRHPWFLRAAAGPGSPFRGRYVWRPVEPGGWSQPWGNGSVWHRSEGEHFYGLFWRGMPDLNYRNRSVRREMMDAAAFWLERGVDGFRLDAVRYLVESGPGPGQADTAGTHRVLKELAARCRQVRPDCLLVGEAWTETAVAATYLGTNGDELDSLFVFDRAGAVLGALREGSADHLRLVLEEEAELLPPAQPVATFLSNHDQRRVASVLGNQPGALRAAAALLLTLPGIPFLYYGEELGTLGAKPDPDLRAPMCWTAEARAGFTSGTPWHAPPPESRIRCVAEQTEDPRSLLTWYRRLIRLRADQPALRQGGLTLAEDVPDGLLVFRRSDGEGGSIWVLQNLTGCPKAGFVLTEPDWPVGAAPPLGPWETRILLPDAEWWVEPKDR